MADLWVPGQARPTERGIVALSTEDMVTMAAFADVAAKYGFAVVCPRCDTTLHGHNTAQADVFAVTCQCREYRGDLPRGMRDTR